MNKHRIIGLIVLMAVAVMIGQYCLNYSKGNRHAFQTRRSLPIAPLDKNMTAPDNAPRVQSTETLIEEHFDTSIENVAVVPAWIVQVAILSSETSAQRLTQQLKELGLDAFLSPMQLQGKAVYRVAAGPFTQQTLALSALSAIQEKLKVTGILKPYTIGEPKEIDTQLT